MELVRYEPCSGRLLIGVLLATWLAVPCAAQYPSDYNGIGNGPMPPATPGTYYQPTVPTPRQTPPAASRPNSWPSDGWPATPQQSSAAAQPPTNELTPCEGTRILAHVGPEVILERDALGPVNDFLQANKDRIPPEQFDATREFLIKKQLKNLVQNKLIYLDAKQAIPSEGWPQVEKQVAKVFEETELDKMMKRVGATSRSELDDRLRKLGTSIEHEKKAYFERELARQWLGTKIKREDEITYDQMVVYYHQHIEEFTTPARVKWEELMTRSLKYPSNEAAYGALAQMGNQVLAGASLAEVAKAASDGPTANKGGFWDWTIKGSLVCKDIDKAIFDLPVGQLSPIIQGPNGFHIVRVTAREDAKVAPFLDAQVDIREKIVKQRSEKQLRAYLAKLEAHTPVSSIFDGQDDPNEQMSQRSGGTDYRR
jgi:parvulin-like peptidyl-prolyl isomerase